MFLLRFLFLIVLKYGSRCFYKRQVRWLNEKVPKDYADKLKLVILLNHTSLWEPLYASCLDNKLLWRVARHGIFPGADVTMNRPIVGMAFKFMAHKPITITRKNDDTWSNFLHEIEEDDLVMILPEGRMRRPNGMDKEGNPMTARGGIADILEVMEDGAMLILYSGGLHHIQVPGQGLPKINKTLHLNMELVGIAAFKKKFQSIDNPKQWKISIMQELDKLRDDNCPTNSGFPQGA